MPKSKKLFCFRLSHFVHTHSLFFSFRKIEQIKRKERSEAHLYMIVELLTDDDFQLHHGPDLVDSDEIKGRLVEGTLVRQKAFFIISDNLKCSKSYRLMLYTRMYLKHWYTLITNCPIT